MNAAVVMSAKHRIVWVVGLMWVAYFLNYCDRQAVFAMFKVLKSDLAMTDTQLGLTGAVFLWVYGLGCPIAGQIADKISKRWLVVGSLVLWSLVTFATGWASSASMLLGLRAAMGISEALFMPAAIALTASTAAPHQRSRAIAILTTAQIAGTVGGAWFGGWMAEQGVWRYAFFALGLAGVLYAVPYAWLLARTVEEPSPSTEDTSKSWAILKLTSIPTFLVLCGVFSVFVFGLWMLYSWLPNYVEGKFSLSMSQAALTATASMQTATLVGLFAGGVMADKLAVRHRSARLWILVASLACCAPCMHWIGAASSLWGTIVGMVGFGLCSGWMIGNIFPAAFEVLPSDSRATAVGTLNFCGAMLSGFAPLIVGSWKQSIGIPTLFSATAVAYLIAGSVLSLAVLYLFPKDANRSASLDSR